MRLNLGSGQWPLKGYDNRDLAYGDGTSLPGFVYSCAPAYPLNDAFFQPVEEIRASHILEHFSHHETMLVMLDWVNVLAPGGLLKVAVPDFDKIIGVYQTWDGVGDPPPIAGWIMGGQTDERDYHKSLFTLGGLTAMMQKAGLVDIRPWESECQDCASLPISLNLQGRKPGANKTTDADLENWPTVLATTQTVTQPEKPPRRIEASDIFAVQTCPRLGFTDNMECCVSMAIKLGIGLHKIGGVFWDQGMSRVIEQGLQTSARYILTMDYDTVFKPEDVIELVRVMEDRPEIDALCPVQIRRDGESPLMTVEPMQGDKTREVQISMDALRAETLRIASGHFGLTLLRTDSIRKMPKPWFIGVPDENGEWGTNRRDADIQFWHQWRMAGLQLHQANRVVVGHLQLMVSWPGENLTARHQYVSDYTAGGKPPGIWA